MTTNNKNLCIIPARGGSKRIPNKNIKDFCGKPIIAYSIETAINSALFDRIVVSTDSRNIADIARDYGAEVPFMRPESLADDNTPTSKVIRHTIEKLQADGNNIETVFCIYATTPFLRVKDLERGYELLTKHNAPSAIPVTSFPSPIYRAMQISETRALEMVWPEYRKIRSQDLKETYHDAGQFYCARVKPFLEQGRFSMKGARPIILSRYLVHDIDTPEDWIVAEKLFKAETVYRKSKLCKKNTIRKEDFKKKQC